MLLFCRCENGGGSDTNGGANTQIMDTYMCEWKFVQTEMDRMTRGFNENGAHVMGTRERERERERME